MVSHPIIPKSSGFTLIEVLVALAVTAVTLAAGLQAAGSLTNNAVRLEQISQAQWCADNQLTALRLSRIFPSTGDSEFACQQLGTEFTGKQEIRPTPNPNFRRVEAKILNAQGQTVLSLSTVQPRF